MIEVAFFISILLDVADTVEDKGKGTTPKECDFLRLHFWAYNE